MIPLPLWLTPRMIGAGLLALSILGVVVYIKGLQWRLDHAQEMQAAAEVTAKAATDANAKLQESLAVQAQAVSDVVAAGERREKAAAVALAAARTASQTHEAKARTLEAMAGTGCVAVIAAVEEAWAK
jgi:hypothetical protein